MSSHIYIANPRFKEDPISKIDWIEALEKVVTRNNDLVVVRKTNKKTGEVIVAAHLQKPDSQWISLSPYGLIHVQNPSKALIGIMFDIASELSLKVYSERLKPYKSPADWEKRTEDYRRRIEEGREKYRKSKRIRILKWTALVIFSLLMGVFLGAVNAT